MKKITTNRDEADVLYRLAIMVESGISVIQALPILAKEFPSFKEPLEAIVERMQSTEYFSSYFQGFGEHFSDFVPALYARSGSIEKGLLAAAEIIEFTDYLSARGVPLKSINEANYYRLFGSLMGGHTPILEAMKIAGDSFLPDDEIRKSVFEPVKRGDSILDGLAANPDFFSSAGRTFMFVGESSGAIDETCECFADLKMSHLLLVLSQTGRCAEDAVLAEQFLEYGVFAFLLSVIDVPLPRVLEMVAESCATPRRQQVFAALSEKVKSGIDLGAAMESAPEDFIPWIVDIIKAAKKREDLDPALRRIMICIKWHFREK